MNINQLESFSLAESAKFKDHLNPTLWDRHENLKNAVKDQILVGAEEYCSYLGLSEEQVVDIVVTGSNASYLYESSSGIDVVVIAELNQDETFRELFNEHKYKYNGQHHVEVDGHLVQFYVQPAEQNLVTSGSYSLLRESWVQIPVRRTLKEDTVKKLKALDLAARPKQPKVIKKKVVQERKPVTYGYGADYLAEVGLTPDGVSASTCQFANEEDHQHKLSDKEIIQDFVEFCSNRLGLEHDVRLKLKHDPQWPVRNKTFGRYNNDHGTLEVAVGQRHIMDVLRTIAHELTHQRQHETVVMPPDAGEDGSEFENEANASAGVLMRLYGKQHPELFSHADLKESILDETPEDERFLQQVGDAVERWAEKFKATNKQKITGFVEPGKIGQITGIKGKTDAQKHLLNLGMMFFLLPKDVDGKHPMGAYRPAKGDWGGDIGADIRYLIPDAVLDKSKKGQDFKHSLLQHETDLGSTVAHELRHALDDYLSKGKYDKSAKNKDYWTSPVELNAFFTQALRSLQQMINDGIVDDDNLQWAIRRVFYNNELISNLIAEKDPRVKRLYSRAYTYFKSQLDQKQNLKESSGYIPTAAEAHDPRFEMALSVDVRPGALGKAANALDLNTDSQGHPQLLRPDGVVERMFEEYKRYKNVTK